MLDLCFHKKKATNSSRKENSSVTTSKQRLKLIIEHVEKSKIQQTTKTKLEPYHHPMARR